MNIFFELVGVVAGTLSASTFFPQLIQTYKTKNVEALSPKTFVILLCSVVLWMIYGVYIGSVQIVFFNAIVVLCALTILVMIKKYKK